MATMLRCRPCYEALRAPAPSTAEVRTIRGRTFVLVGARTAVDVESGRTFSRAPAQGTRPFGSWFEPGATLIASSLDLVAKCLNPR